MDWLTFVVVDPVKAMAIKIWSYVPSLIGAAIILIIGWLLAKFIETIVVRALKALKIDSLTEKAGINKVLAQGDIKANVTEIVGGLIYWLIILVVIATGLNALNLTVAATLMSRLIEYVPNIIGAVFVLILGACLASFIGTIIRTTASNAGISNAKFLGNIAQAVLVAFAIVIAIEQLNIATALITLAVNIILASIGLGIALAFGLGCKDIAAKAMNEFLNNLKK